jgi:hypothetical protein
MSRAYDGAPLARRRSMSRIAFATSFLLTAALATPARADADEGCGEAEPSEDALAALADAQDREDTKTDDAGVQYRVAVHLHVVRRAPQGEGDMPVAQARAITVDALNTAFAAQHIPIAFELAGIDYLTADANTYNLARNSSEEKALYGALEVGGRRNLNIYIVGPRSDTTVTGWAEILGDHVMLRYYPARGGFSNPMTVVHEVGHWFGLLHTFQFGCGTKLAHGDLIRDTPTQKSAHHSCAVTTDTCPDDEGADPVTNIMGYGGGCRDTFSPGQIKRMKFLFRTSRGGKGDDLATDDEPAAEPATGGCSTGRGGGIALGLAALALLRRRRR